MNSKSNQVRVCDTCHKASLDSTPDFNVHEPGCAAATPDQNYAMAEILNARLRDTQSRCDERTMYLKNQLVAWQGRHAMLRHENNKLRRALYRQEHKKVKPHETKTYE